ncbi:hypothetical protein ACFL4G_05850 [Thermodesulfobacteriota bacterium]
MRKCEKIFTRALRSTALAGAAALIATGCWNQPFDMAVSYQAVERYDTGSAASIAHVDFSHPIEGQESLFVPDPGPGETEVYHYPFGLSVEIDGMDAGESVMLECGNNPILLERGDWLSYSSGNMAFEDFSFGAPLSIRVKGGLDIQPFSEEAFLFTPEPMTGVIPDLSGSAADPLPIPMTEDFTISWDPDGADRFVIYIMTEDNPGNYLELLRHGANDETGLATIPAFYLQELTPGATAKITIARKNVGIPFDLPNGGIGESESVVAVRGVGLIE